MELDDILSRQAVLFLDSVTDKADLFKRLADRASAVCGHKPGQLRKALDEREQLGSTGLGNGIAVPHGKVPGLKGVVAVFARLGTPVEFDAIDDQPVDLVMMLLAPVGAGADHLKALARVARILRTDAVVEALRGTTDPERLYEILNARVAAQNAA